MTAIKILLEKALLYLSNLMKNNDTRQIDANIDFYVNTYLPNDGNLLTANGEWLTDENGNYLTF